MTRDLAEGRRRRDEGVAQVQDNNREFVARLRAFAVDHAMEFGYVHADDVRLAARRMGLEPHHPNAWGAIFRGHGWYAIDERPSEVPSNHGRMGRVWGWKE